MESGVNALSGLYLISTTYYNYNVEKIDYSVNALSGLYLISTEKPEGVAKAKTIYVSMPSRAYTSFLLCITLGDALEKLE